MSAAPCALSKPAVASVLMVFSIDLLQDAHGVLHHLLVSLWRVVAERFNDRHDIELFKRFAALFIHTEIADGEERDAARGLARTFVVLNHLEQLSERAVLDQVLAQGV